MILSQAHEIIFLPYGNAAQSIGEDVTTARIFTALALFRLLKGLLRAFPDYITQFYQAQVSLQRLEGFFSMDEKEDMRGALLESEDFVGLSSTIGVDVGEVFLRKCFFQWNADKFSSTKNTSNTDVNSEIVEVGEVNRSSRVCVHHLNIRPASLIVVKGSVGSGKSSFCHALLGEMPRYMSGSSHEADSGRPRLCGHIAYAGQQAWVQSGQLRESILFGLPFEKEKFDCVVDACCLSQDFQELPAGDLTYIGWCQAAWLFA